MRKLVWLAAFIGLELFASVSSSLAIRFRRQDYQSLAKEKKLQGEFPSFPAPPFEVFTKKDLNPSLQKSITRIIRDGARAVERDFNYYPPYKAQLLLLDDSTYSSLHDPENRTGGFYANKKVRLRFRYGDEEPTVVADFESAFLHEYTHLVIASIDGGRTPSWETLAKEACDS